MEERNIVEVDKPRKTKKKKSGYHLSEWSCRREKDYGPIYEKNVAIFPLPPVGTKVEVYVRENYERGRGKDKNVKSRYVPWEACVDPYNIPIIYTVVGYELGIDKPLDKCNYIILEAQLKNRVDRQMIPVIYVSIGYMFLAWEGGISLEKHSGQHKGVNTQMYIAEYSRIKCKNENEKLMNACLEAIYGPKKKYGD